MCGIRMKSFFFFLFLCCLWLAAVTFLVTFIRFIYFCFVYVKFISEVHETTNQPGIKIYLWVLWQLSNTLLTFATNKEDLQGYFMMRSRKSPFISLSVQINPYINKQWFDFIKRKFELCILGAVPAAAQSHPPSFPWLRVNISAKRCLMVQDSSFPFNVGYCQGFDFWLMCKVGATAERPH